MVVVMDVCWLWHLLPSQSAALGTLSDLRPTAATASSPTTHIVNSLFTLPSPTRAVSLGRTPSPTSGSGSAADSTNSVPSPGSPPPSAIASSHPLPAARPVARRLSAAAALPTSLFGELLWGMQAEGGSSGNEAAEKQPPHSNEQRSQRLRVQPSPLPTILTTIRSCYDEY
jgi:hypothetical protein